MRWIRRGISAALVCLVFLADAFAQNLPDGLTLGDDRMRSLFIDMLAGQSNLNLQSFLQRQVICTDDRTFARFLNERGIRTLLITARSGPLALRAGRCDLLIEGAAVRWVRAALSSARPDPGPTPTDRDGPTIQPAADEFTASSGSVAIIADIKDPSGVANAVANGATSVQRNGDRYEFKIRLPNDYAPIPVTISAEDRIGNASARRVAVRRIPACGSPTGLDIAMAREIQFDLNALGLNVGSVDGLIGARSCAAIRRFDQTPFNNWPALLTALARARIGITAQVLSDPTQAEQLVAVAISDPRNTGAVEWIRMSADRRDPEPDRRVQRGETTYRVVLAPGEVQSVRIEALDGRARSLAQTDLTLRRLPDMALILASEQLRGGRIEASTDAVQVVMTLRDPWPGASVDWQISNSDVGDRQRYAGAPIAIDLPMPSPNESSVAIFLAVDREGTIRARKSLTLFRLQEMRLQIRADDLEEDMIEATTPDTTVFVDLVNAWPDAELSIEMGDGMTEIWTYGGEPRAISVAMPPPGQTRPILIRARDRSGEEHDLRTIALRRLAAGPPAWLLPGAVGLLLLGSVIWPIKGFRFFKKMQEQKPSAPTIIPHVDAVPDTTPTMSVKPDQMPQIVLTVDRGGPTDITIIREQDGSDES